MSLKIYGIAASRASRPLWVAHELALAYEHVPVNYQNGGTRTPELLALNPNGHIPVIDDDGVVVFDSNAILLYLADREQRFVPGMTQAKERGAALSWLLFIASGIHGAETLGPDGLDIAAVTQLLAGAGVSARWAMADLVW